VKSWFRPRISQRRPPPLGVLAVVAVGLVAMLTHGAQGARTATEAGVGSRHPAARQTAFSYEVFTVNSTELGASWHRGCPVGAGALREIRMTFWGFDGRPHVGRMIVNESVVVAVVKVFSTLFRDHFPIKEMVPQSAFRGDDNVAAAADDTSGFNCRYAVAAGPPHWSVHAYGEAIDVNDVQNPYVDGSLVIPPAGRAYLNRADVREGMAVPGGVLVDAFVSVGWYWGGRWAATPDYQHFSLTGG
jgi:D-alanyl-D-alanine carboxypeptidase